MLNLVLGPNNSGKTEYVRNLVAEGVNNSGDGFVFIVPEQFSYETEKAMLGLVGSNGMLRVDVLSISRLADVVLDKYGKASDRQAADNGVKMLTMSLALESLSDKLQIFHKYASRPALSAGIVSFATELKQCGVGTDEIKSFSDSLKPSSLKSKLGELALIISLYNSMLAQSYFDTDDSLSVLSGVLKEEPFFEDKTVVIDSFTRFTKQELSIVESIIKQSKQVYFTFDTERNSSNDEMSLFANINMQIEAVKRLALKNNVAVAKPIFLDVKSEGIAEELNILEKNIYKHSKEKFADNKARAISICSAPNKTAECEYVALCIKKLMREKNARCKDIIVFERTKDTYDRELACAFNKFNIPFFEDKRQPVNTQPLIIFAKTLLEISCDGIKTDTLMRHLKTGLAALGDDEISELENYAFIWNIKASQWQNDFTQNPRGYGVDFNEFDTVTLEKLNTYRKKAVAPLLWFKKEFQNADNEAKSQVVYDYLVKENVRSKLKSLAKALSDENKSALCDEQNSVWSLLMQMLDKMYYVSINSGISDKRYIELFDILLSVCDLGNIPQGLDNVTIGVADRTRTQAQKYVFVVGANEDVFPLKPSTQGLLNDRDRIELRNGGIELAQTAEYKQTEEKYTAYKALTSAKEMLVITYSSSDFQGESMTASSIVSEIKSIFPSVKCTSFESLSPLEKTESYASAFEELAQLYNENSEIKSTLKELLIEKEDYKGRLSSLESAVNRLPKRIENTDTAVELFGKDMFLSASRTEIYYKCPFEYYCRYGIKAVPRKEAVIDPALGGSVVHFVFEKIMLENSKSELINMSDDELKKRINEILDIYLKEKMGGEKEKTVRFMKHYQSVSDQTFTIIKRMTEEFKSSEFSPVDFELKIDSLGEIKPYYLELSDGGSLAVSGSVDRVDTMDKDGKKYLRVVDYKSGGKVFNLSDVVCGLSTQMLIYLFAIDVNGKQKYGDIIPSGVLYMSAKPEPADLGRNATQEQIDKKRLKSNRMNGIVLNDINAIEGMEKDIEGIFIPVSLDSDGCVKGNVVSADDFIKLKKKIDSILCEMALSLHKGVIPVLPTGTDACIWCDYQSVCGFEEGDLCREIPKMKNETVLGYLDEEVGENEQQMD